jgi:hypothetical protein
VTGAAGVVVTGGSGAEVVDDAGAVVVRPAVDTEVVGGVGGSAVVVDPVVVVVASGAVVDDWLVVVGPSSPRAGVARTEIARKPATTPAANATTTRSRRSAPFLTTDHS